MKIAAVFATSFLVGSVAASKSAKVGVTCKNVNVNSLSPKALAYAAKAVEMTYDAVHKNEGAHAVAVGAFASSGGILRSKTAGLSFSVKGARLDEPVLQADWESELTAVLSKAPYPALSGAQSCRIDFSFDGAATPAKVVTASSKSEDMHVAVDVKCAGLDLSDLPAHALAVATKALKSSYMAVHSVEGDGRTLEGIQIDGPRVYSDFEELAEHTVSRSYHCTLCRKDDDQEEHLSRSYHCTLCRKDDDEELAEHNMVFSAVSRSYHCTLCRKDDDAESKELIEEKDLAAWQDLFVAGLRSDASGAFKDVQQCVIAMKEVRETTSVF